MEIAPGVHRIPGVIATPYLLVEADGLTLIDAGLSRGGGKILDYVRGLGREARDLKRILITHADRDHVGGLAALKGATGAGVYASKSEAEAAEAARPPRPLKRRGAMALFMGLMGSLWPQAPVTVDGRLTDGQVLPVLGGLRVVATPGHTPGHLSFYLPSAGILFAGDSMVSEAGRLRPSLGWNTWDEAQAAASVRLQARLAPRVVACGHGPVVEEAAGKFPTVGGG